MSTTDQPVLQVSKFHIDFWVEGVWYPAAIDMNFDVQAGKVLAIVGESGSGKTSIDGSFSFQRPSFRKR